MTQPDALPALLARVAQGPIPLAELACDWLPRLERAGLACRLAWVDGQGCVCETGAGRLALVYEERTTNGTELNQI